MHTTSFNYTYLCLSCRHIACVYRYDVYGFAMFFCCNHRYYKAYNIYGYNTSLVFHLESSNDNFEISMKSNDSNESDIDEEQMSQNTNSNSASVIVAGLIGVTGSRVTKFGYKEFPVKDQRLMVCRMYRNCSKRIQDKVNVTSAFTK